MNNGSNLATLPSAAFSGLACLETLLLGDTNCAGSLNSLAPCSALKHLNLRYTKTEGDLKTLCAFPELERLDLTGLSKVRGSIEVLGFLEGLTEIRLQQTCAEGDIGCFENLPGLTAVDISRTVLEGNVAVFKNCEGLMHLSCVANGVDCDALGSLKTTLKDCDLIVST